MTMEGSKFDPLNKDHLTQAWLFVEHFNTEVAEKIQKATLRLTPVGGAREADDNENAWRLRPLILEARDRLRKQSTWSKNSVVTSAERAGIRPLPDFSIIDAVVESLLLPAKPGGQWKRKGGERSNLPKAPFPDRLKDTLCLYRVEDRFSFASREVVPGHVKRQRNFRALYWEEALDPIFVIQNLLMNLIGARDVENANFYLQRWLRREFGIRYNDLMKYSVSRVSREVNELFYAHDVPSRDEVHLARSATLGLPLLLQQIRAIFQKADPQPEQLGAIFREPDPKRDDHLRLALGIYLFLRFCRVFRCRYFWPEPATEERSEQKRLPEAFKETQCVSALRSVEYSYLLSRMFGAIADIPGFTFIFRGGVLPRTTGGRTMLVLGPPGAGKTVFALHKLVSIVSRAGLGVYFSFEESYELIFDRLVTFGFVDYSKFRVERAGDDIDDVVRNWRQKHPNLGLLILYGQDNRRRFDLFETIDRIGGAAAEDWKWRALAIDSINAIEPLANRTVLNDLINKIDDKGFLGVVLAEKNIAGFETLPHLVDTVIELGFYDSKRARWIEVSKCRSQNFHPGYHPFRIAEGKGLRIYPSLPAVQSSLRRRMNSTLSMHRVLRLDTPPKKPPRPQSRQTQGAAKQDQADLAAGQLQVIDQAIDRASQGETVQIHEKGSILLCGLDNAGKTRYALELARASLEWCQKENLSEGPVVWRRARQALEEPSSILVVSFRTTELRFQQNLRADSSMHGWWTRLRYRSVRWYSPGENVGPEQVVADIGNYIRESRRQGVPLQRIIFDELESAEHVLPILKREPLFWATLLQLVDTEAITAIFVVGGEGYEESKAFKELKLGVDYIIEVKESAEPTCLKWPELTSAEASEQEPKASTVDETKPDED